MLTVSQRQGRSPFFSIFVFDHPEYLRLLCRAGTIHYMAPEALNSGKCSHASDVYSLAITIWEIFHRKYDYRCFFKPSPLRVPYFELRKATLVTLSNEIIRGVRPSIEPNKMDKEVKALVQK